MKESQFLTIDKWVLVHWEYNPIKIVGRCDSIDLGHVG